MAKTQAEWEALTDSEASLRGLSTSNTAEWKTLRDMTITYAMAVEAVDETIKTDIQTENDTKQNGTVPWWPPVIKAFQYGDDWLVDANGRGYYAVIDTEKQIVKQASLTEGDDGMLFIKVAKDDGAGNLVPLAGAELTALKDYLKARRPPGTPMIVSSIAADVVKYILTVKYNPLYNKTNLEAAIDAALLSFRDNFSFNAKLYKSQLIAAIENIPGIESVILRLDLTLKAGTVTVLDLVEVQELPAGYFNYDGTSAKTLTAI